MSAKPVGLTVLLSLIAAGAAGAQPPAVGPPADAPPAYGTAGAAPPGSAATLLQGGLTPLANTAASRWCEQCRALPVGGDGPIGQEIYVNTGPTIPFGFGPFAANLKVGWMVEAGGRALLFRPADNRATTLRLGFTFQENVGRNNATTYPVQAFDDDAEEFYTVDARTQSLLRYSGVLALGRDWFFHGATRRGNSLRAGIDLGTRWGGQRLNLTVVDDPVLDTTYRHRSDVFGGVVLGWHAAVEVPKTSWVWFAGLRGEYGYSWSNMLTPVNSNLHEVNILITTGFRY